MNTLIVRDKLDKSDVNFNDAYFFLNMKKYGSIGDTILKDAIHDIDGCEYLGNYCFKSKFSGKIMIDNISTGCKTAINVLLNKDRIVNICECGRNAVDFILKHGEIVVSTTSWIPINNWNSPLIIKYRNYEYTINNKAEYTRWWQDIHDK